MNYRMIALDVDGTLLNDDHEMTGRVIRAVRAAAAEGAEIVLCTGRGSVSAMPVLERLEMDGTMITHNGASILDSRTRSVLHESVLTNETAGRYADYCRERGIHFDMNTSFALYAERIGDDAAAMYRNLWAKPILYAAGQLLPERTVKLSIFADTAVIDGVIADWQSWRHELHYIRSGDNFIDVQHPSANKGAALERLAAMRGVPKERIVAIGNYYNDTGMIAFAGLGVAMGNSPDEVKALADFVAPTNNEDGVAVVLERLLEGNSIVS